MKKFFSKIVACVICACILLSNFNIVNASELNISKEYKESVAKFIENHDGKMNAKFSSDTEYIDEILPYEGQVINQGDKITVSFMIEDTWEYYYTKPVVSLLDSNDDVIDAETWQMVSVSDRDCYEDTMDIDTNTLYPGEYQIFIIAAPCDENDELLENWGDFDCPYILTTFTIAGDDSDTVEDDPWEGHTHTIVNDPSIAPTCTTSGLTSGSHCSECSAVIDEQKVIPALGHDYFDYEVVTEPTAVTAGKMLQECKRCHETRVVSIPKLKATIKLSATKVSLKKNKAIKIKVSNLALGDKVVSWTSKNKKIATVNSKGVIKGIKAGKTKVVVKLKSGKTATVSVTVR